MRLAGKVIFVGFDASDPLIEGVRQKEIQGLVVQNPFNMGFIGVKTIIQVLKKEPVEKRIDTGVSFITLENLDKPEIQEIIKPDLDKWLK